MANQTGEIYPSVFLVLSRSLFPFSFSPRSFSFHIVFRLASSSSSSSSWKKFPISETAIPRTSHCFIGLILSRKRNGRQVVGPLLLPGAFAGRANRARIWRTRQGLVWPNCFRTSPKWPRARSSLRLMRLFRLESRSYKCAWGVHFAQTPAPPRYRQTKHGGTNFGNGGTPNYFC